MNPDMEVVDTVEPEMETEIVDVDDMSDDEFQEALGELSGVEVEAEPVEEAPDESTDDNAQDVDLDSLYVAQMADSDGSLDKPMYLKINGEVVEVSNVNDIKNLAELGSGANKAFQNIAKDTKTIDFLSDNNISMDDLNKLVQGKGQEPMVRPEASAEQSQVDDLVHQIETSTIGDDFLAGVQMLPVEVAQELGRDPDLLADLANEYQGGFAQKVIPHVKQEMAVKQLSFIDAYMSVGKRLMAHEGKVSKVNVGAVASQPKSKQNVSSKVDVDSMSTAEFDKYISKMR